MNPKLSAPPLSEARWSRIEQSLMQRLEEMPLPARERTDVSPRRSTQRVLAVASTAAFAMVAAIALLVVRPWSSSRITTSRVATEASPTHVTLGDATIDLSPESGIVFREEEHATVLVLEHGEVALQIAPRPKDRPFLVEAGEVHVRVVGTEFSVRRAGVGAAVSVRRGVVEVTAHGEVSRLHAGETWPDGPVGSVTAAPAPGPLATMNAPTTGIAPINVAPARVTPSPEPPRRSAVHRRSSVSAATAASRAAAADPAAPPPAASPTPQSAETSAAPPALAVAPPQEPLPSISTEASPQVRYEAAEQIERKDPDGALRAYLALARGDGSWAQDALFAAGRLQADRGARADAVKLLEEYLRRFPRGSNAQDARTLREALH